MKNAGMVFAAISGCLAVILGAMGAHALSEKLSPKSMHAYETATHYQMLHSLAIIGMVAIRDKYPLYFKTIVGLFMAGIILFSGSIYILVIGDLSGTDLKWVGPVTPLGGLCMVAGWATLVVSAIKCKQAIKE